MSTDHRLTELLDQWEELREQGRPASVEELCRGCPELAAELRRRVEALEAIPSVQPAPPRDHVPPTAQWDSAASSATRPGPEGAEVVAPPPGAPAIPGYAILRELGHGGMGVVWLARDLHLNRPVALKMILTGPYASPQQRQRFQAEVEAAARLQHPNIVQVYGVGEVNGSPYFSLEYVDGGSLAQRLDGTPRPPRPAAELVAALADGVQAAHERGVVHRDLKPANVLLTLDGRPKITDFGLAKRLDSDAGLTGSGAVMGTPEYMAPEQAAGQTRAAGPAADVHALGVILYELLTGRPPFRGATTLETLRQVQTLEPVPARRLQPQVPRDLDTVCLKCLQKDPAKRYASAAELADDLRRFLRGEPVKARPTPAWERALKWGRRRPAAAALLAVSAAALLTVALLAAGYSARLKVARDRAQQSEARAAREKEEAEANYRLARRLVDDLSAKLSDEDNASLEELRQYFLHSSLAYYERFAQARGDEPALRAARGLALLRLARITGELGAKESRALPLYHEALKVFEGLLRDHPEDAGYRNDLAQVYYWLGRAYADLGQPEKAEGALRRASGIQERLLEGAPKEAAYRRALAATWFALGQACFARGCGRDHVEAAYRKALGLLGEVGRAGGLTAADEDMVGDVHQGLGNFYRAHKEYDKARASYLKALAVEETLVRAHPGVANYGNDLGSTYFGLATIDYLEGRTQSAWDYLQKSRTIRERLVEGHPSVTQFVVDLGRTYRQLGNQSTHAPERIDWYTQSIRALDGVLKKEPSEREARRLADWSYAGRARALTGLGRYAEALDDWGRVGAAFRAQVRQAAVGYAQTLACVGRTGEALDEVAKLDNTHLQPTAAIDLARVYSLCARAARHDAALGMVTGEALGELCARRALVLLEEAAAAGAFKGGGRRGVLKNDPMFAPLRGRKDFQKLLAAEK